jgi:hypothetical protein
MLVVVRMLLASSETAEKQSPVDALAGEKPPTVYIDTPEIAPELALPEAPVQRIKPEINEAELVLEQRTRQITQAVAELKTAPTPEARQIILDGIRHPGLEFVTMIDIDLQRTNLAEYNLENANLTKTILKFANLRGANLRGANLFMAQFIEADLQYADLSRATLERSFMSGANMRGAFLIGARIGCSLWGVNLEEADLQDADLRGAELLRTNLRGANLAGVQLEDAKINSDTILPDGKKWNQRDDITRFTDVQHPDFWRSDDPSSPAYYGRGIASRAVHRGSD